jgi:hypothetical protein
MMYLRKHRDLAAKCKRRTVAKLEKLSAVRRTSIFVGSDIIEIVFYRKFAGTAGKSHYKANEYIWLVSFKSRLSHSLLTAIRLSVFNMKDINYNGMNST